MKFLTRLATFCITYPHAALTSVIASLTAADPSLVLTIGIDAKCKF